MYKPTSSRDAEGQHYAEIPISREDSLRFTYVRRKLSEDVIVIQRVTDGIVFRRSSSGEGVEIPVSKFRSGEVMLALGACLFNGDRSSKKQEESPEWEMIQELNEAGDGPTEWQRRTEADGETRPTLFEGPDIDDDIPEGPPVEDVGLPAEEFPEPAEDEILHGKDQYE